MPDQFSHAPRFYRFVRVFFLFCTLILCASLAFCSLVVTTYFP